MREDEYEKLKRKYRMERKERRERLDEAERAPVRKTGAKPVRRKGELVNLREYAEKSRKHKKADERKKGLNAVNILSFCFFALFLVYVGSVFFKSLTAEEPMTVQVVYGSVDIPIVHSGIIIREEAIVVSPLDGAVYYNANDGDRLKKGSAVCEVYDEKSRAQIEDRLVAVNTSIMSLQEKRSDYSMYQSDINSANAIIKNEIDKNIVKLASFNIAALYSMKEKISQTLSVRNNLLLNENTGSLVGATLEKDRYEAQLSNAVNTIYIEQSGIIAYKTDGLEDILTPEKRFSLLKEQTEMTVDYDKILYTKEAAVGKPVFRLITSNEWYIASYIPNSVALTLEEGKTATLYIVVGDDYSSLQMTIEKKIAGDNESYLVFKSTKLLTEFMNKRSLDFKINLGISEGFKVPNSAIAERMLLKIPAEYVFEEVVHGFGYPSDCVMKKGAGADGADLLTELEIINRDEQYCYVLQELGQLKLGDAISSREDDTSVAISEFELVKGVYTVNSGITVFKIIQFGEGAGSNSSYTILDPKLNKSLKIDDTIISDVKKMVN